MIITLVTLRLLFLLQFPSALAIDVISGSSGGSAVVLTEQVFQPVHEPSGGQQHRGIAIAVDVVNQILRIDIALRRRLPQPVKALFLVTGNIAVIKIQLAESILRKLVSLFSGSDKPADGGFHILWHIFALEIELAELIGCILIFLLCG